jgi:molybdopterin-guanine dinucleotide biosynthesis protein B
MRVIGIAGWSGSGKTTLLTKVIPQLVARGMKVSTLKHAHHAFDVDTPGKDSHTHRVAGATEVLVTSANRWALMHELRGDAEPPLFAMLRKLSPVDLVIVEGFKATACAKVEVFRKEIGKLPLHPQDEFIRGIASDIAFPHAGRPVVALNDVDAVIELILQCAEPLEHVLAREHAPHLAPTVV